MAHRGGTYHVCQTGYNFAHHQINKIKYVRKFNQFGTGGLCPPWMWLIGVTPSCQNRDRKSNIFPLSFFFASLSVSMSVGGEVPSEESEFFSSNTIRNSIPNIQTHLCETWLQLWSKSSKDFFFIICKIYISYLISHI